MFLNDFAILVNEDFGESAVANFATSGDTSGLAGDTFTVNISAVDASGFEQLLNGNGKSPLIKFLKNAKTRREL